LAELYSLIGELYFNENAFDSARTYYTKATEVGRSYEIAAEAQYRIAEIDLTLNRTKDAIKNLKKIDQLSPSLLLRDKMQILLARIYRESGQYDEAINMINEKLNNPSNESIWGDLELQLGLIYLAQEDFESAESRFTQVEEKYKGKPVEADASFQLAELYMTHYHDYEKASPKYDNVVKIEKTSLRAFEARSISSEIKRFNTIRKRLENLYTQIAAIDLNPKTSADTIQPVTEISQEPEVLKKNLEKKNTEKRKPVDTLAVFKEYYNSLYDIAEIYYFNFKQPDSALAYLEKVSQAIPYNHLRDKAFYGLYQIHVNLKNSAKAAEYRAQLSQKFPESEYLAGIENRPVSLPPRETEAENLLASAEEIRNANPYQAITQFDSIARNYADTKAGQKGIANIAYTYHHKLFDLNNALTWYKYFVDTYPTSELCPMMRGTYDQLKAVENAIAKAAQDSTSVDSTVAPGSAVDSAEKIKPQPEPDLEEPEEKR